MYKKALKTYYRISGIIWLGLYIIALICGGESGSKARPMLPQWAAAMQIACEEYNIPFFFKQHGEWVEFDQMPPDIQLQIKNRELKKPIANYPDTIGNIHTFHKLGKHLSGSLLYGREYKDMPMIYKPLID